MPKGEGLRMKYCTKCGGQLDDEDDFCYKCGAEQKKRKEAQNNGSMSQFMIEPQPGRDDNTVLAKENNSHNTEQTFNEIVSSIQSDSMNVKNVQTDEQKRFLIRLRQTIKAMEDCEKLETHEYNKKKKFLESYDAEKKKIYPDCYTPFLIIGLFFTLPLVMGILSFVAGVIIMLVLGLPITSLISLIIICILLAIISGAIFIGGIPIATSITKNKIPKLRQFVSDIENQEYKLISPYWDVLDEIPDNYRYVFAMSKIAEYFENKRADNLKEAINLF